MIFGRRHTPKDNGKTHDRASGQSTHHEPSAPEEHGDTRPAGLRLTEKGLLPIFGPAQVGDSTAPLRPASEAERSRDRALRTTLTRVVGADGKSYVVAVADETDEPEAGQPVATDD